MKTKAKWILVGLLILLPVIMVLAFEPLKKRYQRYICGTNLIKLGKAKTVYSNNCDDEYSVCTGSQSPNELFILHDPNIPILPHNQSEKKSKTFNTGGKKKKPEVLKGIHDDKRSGQKNVGR